MFASLRATSLSTAQAMALDAEHDDRNRVVGHRNRRQVARRPELDLVGDERFARERPAGECLGRHVGEARVAEPALGHRHHVRCEYRIQAEAHGQLGCFRLRLGEGAGRQQSARRGSDRRRAGCIQKGSAIHVVSFELPSVNAGPRAPVGGASRRPVPGRREGSRSRSTGFRKPRARAHRSVAIA